MSVLLGVCLGYLAGFWSAVWVAVRLSRWAREAKTQHHKVALKPEPIPRPYISGHDYARWMH